MNKISPTPAEPANPAQTRDRADHAAREHVSRQIC